MRRLGYTLAAAAIAVAAPASASSWIKLGRTSTGGILFIDTESLNTSGDHTDAWFKIDQTADQTTKDREAKQMMRFRCRSKQVATMSVISYGADGRITYSKSTPEFMLSFEPLVPDTVGETMSMAACAYEAGATPR